MVNNRQFRSRGGDDSPGVVAQLGGVGHTVLLAALGAAARTARSAPPMLTTLSDNAKQSLHRRTKLPELPRLDTLLQRSLERVLEGAAIPTREELTQVNERLQGLQQRLETLSQVKHPGGES